MMVELFSGMWGPFIIFGLRIIDVTLATLRLLLTMRGAKKIVPVIGFFEALIWVLAVGTAIQNLHSIWHLLGYAGGFGAGTLVGLAVEEKLAYGLATVRIICTADGDDVADGLRERGYGVTEFSGYGRQGKVEMIYTLVPRRQVREVMRTVEALDDDAFISVEEPRLIQRGWLFGRRRS
jgi:uncharacterized protein YebE (UPF0316 family)